MHSFGRVLSLCLLAFFLFSLNVGAAECLRGTILYRQAFDELSDPELGGIRKGTDGADFFSLTVSRDSLLIDNHTDRKSYTVFPCALPETDHTVEFTFSFDDISASNAYVAFMLTSRGDAPDNITAVTLRANGECEGFGTLGDEITEMMASGERVSVKIPVQNGDHYEITVSVGDVSETLTSKTAGRIPRGSIGFIVRNASVRVHEVSVINGIGYKAVTGRLKGTSTWTDKDPYDADANTYSVCEDVGLFLEAPQTSDPISAALLVVCLSAFTAVRIIKRKRA